MNIKLLNSDMGEVLDFAEEHIIPVRVVTKFGYNDGYIVQFDGMQIVIDSEDALSYVHIADVVSIVFRFTED